MASTRANYVKIGVFVSLAVVIAIVTAMVLGTRSFDANENLMETYIEESVQGLDVGSAVKFRGIPIGKIKEISFVWPTYVAPDTPEGRRAMHYARVVFAIDYHRLNSIDYGPFEKMVEDGVRIYVKAQGITGLMYLDMDFPTTPFAKPTLPVLWEPQYAYIPAAPGLGRTVTDLIDSLSDQLAGIDLRESVAALVETITLVRDELRTAKLGDSGQRINALLEQLNAIVADFDTWRRSAELDDKANAIFATLSAFEQSAKTLEAALPELLQNANDITANLNATTRDSRAQIAEALDNMRTAGETLNVILDRLKERPSLLLRDPTAN